MIPEKLQEKRDVLEGKRKFRAKTKTRHRETTRSPKRLTSCIFQKPLSRITSNPGNITMRRKDQENLEKPQQLCALKRLNDHHSGDRKGNFLYLLDPNTPVNQSTLGRQDEANGVKDLHTSSESSPAHRPCLEEEKKATQQSLSFHSPGVTMPVSLQLSPSYDRRGVTTADIRRQAMKVKRARKRLAEALEEDRLAKLAENIRD
ncbi:methyl-CpG-binding domain protein 3-like 2B [Acomys russatus]|uniref:methyl-CpG-binding domain protein 3-like 2B n=1 Tax=Acomys russatus TaxID=60746 RepID=UPI0021E304F8|nr:methyl-CpG-binding domain protein 3-like 2B [Acomys russatus]